MLRNLRILPTLLTLIMVSGINSAVYSDNATQKITITSNLTQEGEESAQTKTPILLLVSKPGCPYCTQIKNEVLNPMLISTEYIDQVIIRELVLNPADTIIGFDGTATKISDIANKYAIKVTPTLLFLGPNGEELEKRIIGINTVELFSYYVAQAIEKATNKLNSE